MPNMQSPTKTVIQGLSCAETSADLYSIGNTTCAETSAYPYGMGRITYTDASAAIQYGQ
jgi:hypothetical protein